MDVRIMSRCARSCEHAAHPQCRGQAAISLLFFLFAAALFALPFARTPDGPAWDREDLTRNSGIAKDFTLAQDIAYAADVLDADFASKLQTLVDESSEKYFGMRSEWLIGRDILEIDRLPAGRRAYETECAGCHGRNGDGAGPAATFLDPRPRNFRRGAYKFTTTSTGMRPKRSDLFGTITRGLAGSAMPSFRLLNEERRHDIVEYVRYLGM